MRQTFGDSFARRDGSLENSYPRYDTAAGPTFLFTTGAAWNWSAYKQVIAATVTNFVVSGLAIKLQSDVTPGQAGTFINNVELELAIGAAGSEVTFEQVPLTFELIITNPQATTSGGSGYGLFIPLGPKTIPSGTRIAVRIRQNMSSAGMIVRAALFIVGYDGGNAPVGNSTYTLRGQQTGIQKGRSYLTPSGSFLTLQGGGGAFGAWTQILASAASELLFVGVALVSRAGDTGNNGCVIEVGTGAVGSEKTRARIWCPAVGVLGLVSGVYMMPRPLLVKPGERVAARVWDYAGAGDTFDTQWLYEQH